MMAAYEVGKSSDDVRNSVVVSLQSSHPTPNKSGDDGRDNPFFIPAVEPDLVFERPAFNGWSNSRLQLPSIQRAFNARAPPHVWARLV